MYSSSVHMIHVGFSELRRRLAHFMDRAVDDRAPVLVTRQGHEPVVMLSKADYEAMVDLLQDRRCPPESAQAFLKRMRAIGPVDDEAIAEMEAAIAEHKRPHLGIEL